MEKVFCIDIGNTRTHCAVFQSVCNSSKNVGGFNLVETKDYSSAAFVESFFQQNTFENSGANGIAYCSVVPKIAEDLEKNLNARKIKFLNLNCKNSPLLLDVRKPEQVGQDRIASAIGAGLFFNPPYIVVDMGTAVTIDLVDERGNYAGGAIAPGLHAFTDYLCERTAQLPRINLNDDSNIPSIGKDTVEAMRVGCLKGFCKLADGIIEDIEKSHFAGESAKSKTIFTGGSVSLLPKKWLAERQIECNLAQLGLAKFYFAKMNFTRKT